MNNDTVHITSQGEIIRKEAPIEAKKPMEATLLLEDQPAVLLLEDQPAEASSSIVDSLWDKVRVTTEAAAHMAGLAANTVYEKAHDAAVAVEHAGEKLMEQTKEIVMDLEHKAEDVAEVVIEQGQHKAAELYDVASSVGEQAKMKAGELLSSAQHLGEQALEKGGEAAQTTKSVGNDALEQAKSLGQQALVAGQKALDDAKVNVDDAVAQAKEVGQSAVDQAKVSAGSVATQARGLGQRAFSAGSNLMGQTAPLVRSASKSMKKSASAYVGSVPAQLILTMDVVSHIQRIADRTGDAVLHETARKAHSACAKGVNEAPGVHLVWITPQQANDLVNLAIRTQDHELADFARYCQSVAATTHIGVEPTPGKIQEEILKGYQELQQQGRVHTGPGYGAAFASVNRVYPGVDASAQQTAAPAQKTLQTQKSFNSKESVPPQLALTMDVVSHIQRIADRTGNPVLHETARKAHSACAKGASDAPGVHLTWITPQQASELMNLASRTQDQELIDFARYCQSVAATTQVGVEPSPGKIQEEILKGRQELQKQSQEASPAQPVIGSAAL